MTRVLIERISVRSEKRRVANYFDQGAPYPVIFTDAADEWPARGKWTLDFFASTHGSQIGIAPLAFGAPVRGKTTLLGAFINYLDRPYADIPGVWVDDQGAERTLDDSRAWSFLWEAFRNDPALFGDVSPFPAGIPNLTASLPRDVYDVLEEIQGRQFTSIYISRKNTVTPLHADRDHTFGCLVQFAGRKKVVLYPSGSYERLDGVDFDPERPDYLRYPSMRGCVAHHAVLRPVEMLIIPPDWPHYTRSQDHSITLSQSFFNHLNFGAFMRSLLEDLARHTDGPRLLGTLGKILEPSSPPTLKPSKSRAA